MSYPFQTQNQAIHHLRRQLAVNQMMMQPAWGQRTSVTLSLMRMFVLKVVRKISMF